MSVWIKVCGLTTEDGVDAAIEAGVDAVGFVFAPSKREVSPARAAELARRIPPRIARVAVMLHPSQAWVDEVCRTFRPDVLQTDLDDLATLRIPQSVETLPVVRGAQASAAQCARVLFEGPVSGAGERSDWTLAARLARETQLILAGGLTPGNVRDALSAAKPFGVDVSSGVESGPGVKDPVKICEFVRNARAGVVR
jgi:phosphoribosylanthranilate isomerase